MESGLDFKSLRAKFQEDLERPTLPSRPKRLLPAPTCPNAATHLTGVVPFRDDRKASLGKRPVSVPSCFTHPAPTNGEDSDIKKQSFKDRHPPFVLPKSSSNETKYDFVSSSKLVTSPIKCKKKTMPTPFKPTKFSKCIKDILENTGDHSENSRAHKLLLAQTSNAKENMGNGFSQHGGQSNGGSLCPSPEQPVTPPPPTAGETSAMGSVTSVLSTLERAKKKFSPKNLLVYARPKSYCSSRVGGESPPILSDYENLIHESERCLTTSPNSTTSYVLQPRGGANGTTLPLNGGVKLAMPDARVPPPIRLLPDLMSLGALPKKPPRPPQVDLSFYTTQKVGHETTTDAPSMTQATDVLDFFMASERSALPPPPEFEAPSFPDFEQSVLAALNSNAVSLTAMELEAADFGAPPLDISLIPPRQEKGSDGELQHPHGCDEVIHYNAVSSAEGTAVPLEPLESDSQITALESGTPWASSFEISTYGAHNIHTDSFSSVLSLEPGLSQWGGHYEAPDNVYEEVEAVTKFHFGQNSRKWKSAPRNPYAVSPGKEEPCRSSRPIGQRKDRVSPEQHDNKEQRKREKQRLEREKKEQKEREKKENEMKKKFKITGQEEPMYFARVLVSSKPRKHHLQVESGDTVSIIRTTNCPKGKWLARDAQHKYGYISVMNVELNMKEMLELGRRASQTAGRVQGEADTLSVSSRSSHHNPVLTSSFSPHRSPVEPVLFSSLITDDSEEWTGDDDDEASSPSAEHTCANKASSMPDIFGDNLINQRGVNTGSVQDLHSQVNHEALQKLAVFFQNKAYVGSVAEHTDSTSSLTAAGFLCAMVAPPHVEDEDFNFADVELLPPPDLYADSA